MSGGYKKIFCQFKLFGDETYNLTEDGGNTSNPTIKYQKLISYPKVDAHVCLSNYCNPQNLTNLNLMVFSNCLKLINDYATYPLFVQVHGVQVSLSDESNTKTTKEWFLLENKEKAHSEAQLRDVSSSFDFKRDEYLVK